MKKDTFFDLGFQKKKLLDDISFFSDDDREKIYKAYQLAEKHHSGQERDEGGPYLLHGIRVAKYLLELLDIADADVVCAALLHDTVEDTPLTLKYIQKLLGKRVSFLVDNVTRKKSPDETEKNRYERKYRNFLETLRKDLAIRSIKACDWLDNMTSWPRIPMAHPAYKRIPRWVKEAETMYIPLAESINPKLVEKMRLALEEIKNKDEGRIEDEDSFSLFRKKQKRRLEE